MAWHNTSSSSVDRISDLPESLISYILSLMPTRDAVATSILSRSWRFRWTKVTSFEFDNINTSSSRTTDLVDSVNMVLLNHSGEPIEKFVLLLRTYFSPFVYTWASIAIARKVRVLCLRVEALCELHLPSSVYTSGTLETLELHGTLRVTPPKVVCLPKLTSIIFNEVIYSNSKALHQIISGCPVLDTLKIRRVSKMDNLVVCSISSATLKTLWICFLDRHKGFTCDTKLDIDAPALEELRIEYSLFSAISIQQRLTLLKRVVLDAPKIYRKLAAGLMKAVSYVNCFLALESVAIRRGTWTGRGTWPVNASFERLPRLFIRLEDAGWSYLMDLLDGCSSVLRELAISHSAYRDGDPARVPRCLSSLNRIILLKFHAFDQEMEMLEFFLDHCLTLERVDIWCDGNVDRINILNEVSKLSRASPACKIACVDSLPFEKYIYYP